MDYSPRIQIALSIPQAEIPLTPSTPKPVGSQHPTFPIGPSAFSPAPLLAPSPVQRLVQQHLVSQEGGVRKEYDLLVVPITNSNWKARWEKMCISSTDEEPAEMEVEVEDDGSWGNLREDATITIPEQENKRKRKTRPRHSQPKNRDQDEARIKMAEMWRAGNDGSAFKRGEVNVTRTEEIGSIIGLISPWLELDSESEGVRLDCELALNQELSYCQHLRVGEIVLPPIRNDKFVIDYARAIKAALRNWNLNLVVRVPLIANLATSTSQIDPYAQSWDWWNAIRHVCGYDTRLSVAVDLPPALPVTSSSSHRWHAEPLKAVFIPASSFIPNAKQFPVLSKACQSFIKGILKFRPTIVLEGINKNLHQSGGQDAYATYIRYLEKNTPEKTPVEVFANGYQDYLQSPLQPLMDNLGDDTYEGFERDPVKYRQYEEAIYQALLDRPSNRVVKVLVCGAGRGPLVAAALSASERSGRAIQLTAVEKNPNAYVILQERKALEWGSNVTLVFSDMRDFSPTEKADILVSELLGSFGDNELSPECLDGVIRCLDESGVSIPCSYSSWLAPITTSKIHAELSSPTFKINSPEGRPAEQPYVVMLNAFHILSGRGGREDREKVQECWNFFHGPESSFMTDGKGLPLNNHHNIRTASLTFHIPSAGICHGFAGYFEAVLYNDVTLSIHPERGDQEMLSWFPILFPLKDPLYLPARSELDVHMFRLTERRKVWFEWSAESFLPVDSFLPPPLDIPAQMSTASTAEYERGSSLLSNGRQEAFVNAAPSPALSSGTMQSSQSRGTDSSHRIKIGQTVLHNPGGKISWIGL
ncbi:PRMT5-domain-containing protein [Atractiella rhizophila]|nr:PRMT5-domain-containing protein [Atractiella rhizophila]